MAEMHFVSTMQEALELIKERDRFWVSNCGCREKKGECSQSRIDVCLFFSETLGGTGSGFRKVDKDFVEGILTEAKDKQLVTRPFRKPPDLVEVDGICFCCADCCEYFTEQDISCDKGSFIERTDTDACTDCGTCVEVCYFKAREMEDGELVIDQEECYGCGLCADVCPEICVQMVARG